MSGIARAIFTNFSVRVAYGPGSVLLQQGNEIPRERGNFGGCPNHSNALTVYAAAVAAVFAAKGIMQSPITSCSRRDHSICQASANRNAENSEHK